MRSAAFSVCLFLNLMLFGICGYIYLLWLTYWRRLWNQKQEVQSDYDSNDLRKNIVIDYYDDPIIASFDNDKKTQIRENEKKMSQLSFFHKDSYSNEISNTRLKRLKTKIIAKLRQVLIDESNTVNLKLDNRYGVQQRKYYFDHQNISCDFLEKTKFIETIKKSDNLKLVNEYIPEQILFSDHTYNNCAIVTNAGSLRHSNLGSFIDSHDFVLRFNNAPVQGYENDVGTKTNMRILNSQIPSNEKFQFLTSDLYKKIKLLVWDPSNYTATLQEWIEKPEHNFINAYINFRKATPESNFHILNPSSLWVLWDFIQAHTSVKIKLNPPSSGFLGILLLVFGLVFSCNFCSNCLAFLLPHCFNINIMEYIPSERVTTNCHYYSQKSDPLCTYGVWHPLAAEKLIALNINTASDRTVFNRGYISIPGFKKISC